MAQQSLFHRAGPTEEQRRRDDQQHRRNLRIAIRQLERAELYLVALYSLDIAGEGVEERVDDLIRDLRGLRQDLARLKAVA
jgi:hypothetical protein